MSAQFAIPATTFVLRAIVNARLKAIYGTPFPTVSIQPPPRPPSTGTPPVEAAGLVLYLHHAASNPAWRNMYEPHVDGMGKRFAKAPLVLDLHYLLGAFGADLEREAVLGIAMSALHRNGIVPRPMIQQLLAAFPPPNPIQKVMDGLTGEPLYNQFESITVSQQALDVDMSTKIWSALQSPMRPSAYYMVTTVFLDTGELYPAAPLVKSVAIAGRPVADPDADPAGDDVILAAGSTP